MNFLSAFFCCSAEQEVADQQADDVTNPFVPHAMPVSNMSAQNSASPALSQADEEEYKLEAAVEQQNTEEVKQDDTVQ